MVRLCCIDLIPWKRLFCWLSVQNSLCIGRKVVRIVGSFTRVVTSVKIGLLCHSTAIPAIRDSHPWC